jgi:hypothetical protein
MPTNTPNRATRRKADQTAKKIQKGTSKVKRDRQTEYIARHGVTDAATWRKSRQPVLVQLPSGNICRAINRGMDAFLKQGGIPNSLMPIISAALAAGEGRPGAIAADVLTDPAQLAAAVELANTITCECVLEPKIYPVPTKMVDDEQVEITDPAERITYAQEHGIDLDAGMWVDETDWDDRNFIMNWVMGGTQDVEKFREEFAGVVDDVHASDGDEPEA